MEAAEASEALGRLLALRGENKEAVSALKKGLVAASQSGDQELAARLALELSVASGDVQDWDGARRAGMKAVQLSEGIGGEARRRCLMNLAGVSGHTGELEEGAGYAEKAGELSSVAGCRLEEASAYDLAGQLWLGASKTSQAAAEGKQRLENAVSTFSVAVKGYSAVKSWKDAARVEAMLRDAKEVTQKAEPGVEGVLEGNRETAHSAGTHDTKGDVRVGTEEANDDFVIAERAEQASIMKVLREELEDMRDEIRELRQFKAHVLMGRRHRGRWGISQIGALLGLVVALALGAYYHRFDFIQDFIIKDVRLKG